MQNIKNETSLIAFCGLYCGSCQSYIKNKCKGCAQNEKASWCKIRTCCIQYKHSSCADCKEFSDVRKCKKYNNFVSKVIGFVLHSDRAACIDKIKQDGNHAFASYMSSNGLQTIRKS